MSQKVKKSFLDAFNLNTYILMSTNSHNEAMMLVANYIKSQKFLSQSLILLMMIGLEAENPSSG